MTTMTVFERVARGEMSPEEGAQRLMPKKRDWWTRPAWMPRPLFVVCTVIGAVVLAPILFGRRDA